MYVCCKKYLQSICQTLLFYHTLFLRFSPVTSRAWNEVDGIPLPCSGLEGPLGGVGAMTRSSTMSVDVFPKPLAMCASSCSNIKLSKIALFLQVDSTSECKVGPCIKVLNGMFSYDSCVNHLHSIWDQVKTFFIKYQHKNLQDMKHMSYNSKSTHLKCCIVFSVTIFIGAVGPYPLYSFLCHINLPCKCVLQCFIKVIQVLVFSPYLVYNVQPFDCQP